MATASSTAAGNGCSGARRYRTATTLIPVYPAMGMLSPNDPESALKLPPCRFIRTLWRLLSDRLEGVTIRTGTPAMVDSAIVLGQSLLHAAFWRAPDSSICARRCSSDSGGP